MGSPPGHAHARRLTHDNGAYLLSDSKPLIAQHALPARVSLLLSISIRVLESRAHSRPALEALLTGSEAGARRRLLGGVAMCCVVGGECAGAADAGQAAVASGLVRVVCWNARHLRAAAVDAKRAWLAEQVEASRPAVVVLCEVDGEFKAMKALRSWASSALKYDMRFLVGEGGGATNGIVVLVDRAQGSFAGFKRLALRAVGVEVVHKADAQKRAYAAVHGVLHCVALCRVSGCRVSGCP